MSKSRLADLGQIVTGSTPSSKEPHLFGSDVPFLTPSDMEFDRRNVPTERGISAAGTTRFKTRLLPSRAVSVVCIGATIGKTCMTDSPVLTNQQINSIVVDESRHSADYVYYLMQTMRDRLRAVASGAATPIINKSVFGSLEISIPDRKVQTSIGDYLKAFDDLIENNRRRIEILEEMARLLYREWFVHFRFPGHEDVELVDSDLGPIPKGWDQTCLADEIKLERVNVKPFEHPDEEFDHYSIPAFDDRRLPSPELGADIRSGKYLLSGECVMVSKLNPRFPRVWRVDRSDLGQRAVASTEFLVLTRPIGWTLAFVYGLVTSSDFASSLATTAGGTSTSHQRVRPADVMNMAVVKPPSEFVLRHSDQVQPMLKLADKLIHQNGVLRAARDLLLPRLVSGELDVSELDLGLVAV